MSDRPAEEDRRRLMELAAGMTPEDRRALLRFAEFLAASPSVEAPPPPVPQVPLSIARPAVESAVGALKRLKRTYPMIDADASLLDEASQLLMRRMLGDPEREVIDKMEALFAERYTRWRKAGEAAASLTAS